MRAGLPEPPAIGSASTKMAEPMPVRLFFEFHGGTTDPTFRFTGATIRRVTRFDGRPVQLVL